VWFYAGLVVFVAGLVISIIVAINFATTPMDEPIAKGIYRYSRHPGYIGMFLIYLGVGIASASWVFLLVSVVLLILISFAAIDEERYCLGKYGEAYREYMNRTPRWIRIPKTVKSK
jgi:protein-S-isoprenylcysteine O-methyltransferase Ste14